MGEFDVDEVIKELKQIAPEFPEKLMSDEISYENFSLFVDFYSKDRGLGAKVSERVCNATC